MTGRNEKTTQTMRNREKDTETLRDLENERKTDRERVKHACKVSVNDEARKIALKRE